uniref:Uncharacterized protein n=1 Tax=Setaria italica TaxID=4555 RepID=K3ZYG4_SETIT
MERCGDSPETVREHRRPVVRSGRASCRGLDCKSCRAPMAARCEQRRPQPLTAIASMLRWILRFLGRRHGRSSLDGSETLDSGETLDGVGIGCL